ncbi:MAG TPA: phosphopentomutase [Planctomycetota bacterium]|nr:phosphopentomutase [Planctomycetota bacterium]
MGKLFDRAVVVVLDSVGAGALPDAARFGDEGSDTLGHIRDKAGLAMPVLGTMGLGRFVRGIGEKKDFTGASARLAEVSNGKDTLVGHWEMVGVVSKVPFRTYPEGFPKELISKFEKKIGRGVLGNKVASGTEIIAELGAEHVKTGKPIVYTSADSVFQVAAHEEVIPLDELYKICAAARELLVGEHQVARVIARPFVGSAEKGFTRTPHRHDYAVTPPAGTLLDQLAKRGDEVVSVGKIRDIFDGQGIGRASSTESNRQGMEKTIELTKEHGHEAMVFTNLVDFDMLYGHRRDVPGYKRSLEELDALMPALVSALGPRDALFVTADHGNDPTFRGTDHTREYVPLVVYGKNVRPVDLGVRRSFADLGQTIADNFGLKIAAGESFLGAIS